LVICFFFPAFAQAGVPACIRKPEARAKLNLRTPASKTSKKKIKGKKNAKVKDDSVKLSQYTPLTWTGKKENGWMEVKAMNGRNYWVRRRDLSFSMKCLSVQVKQSRLRMGPGSQYERAPVAQKGDVFLDLGGEDGWTQVMNSKGEKAWINLDHTWRPASRMRMIFQPDK
jgi:uncharacterized protein YgiM (DUF1202 family)